MKEGIMRLIVLVLFSLFASFAFAADSNGCDPTGVPAQIETDGTDAVSLTVVNSFSPGHQCLGLDFFTGSSVEQILVVCRNSATVTAYELDGVAAGSVTLDPLNTNCFGFAWNDISGAQVYHTNDWTYSDIYTSEDYGSSWTASTNPAGNTGRGMDFDGTDYWQTDRDAYSVWRFQPGVGAEEVAVPGISSGQLSGLTTFPYGGNLGIAIANYLSHYLYFFEWDGSSLSSLGSAACPGTNIYISCGLTYNPATENMHWSYKDNDDVWKVVEFSFDITPASLERTSWGSIKSSF